MAILTARLFQHEFVQRLSAVLVTVGASPVARMAAGLQLKNQLTSKDPDMKFQYQQRWLTISVESREYIKKNVRMDISHHLLLLACQFIGFYIETAQLFLFTIIMYITEYEALFLLSSSSLCILFLLLEVIFLNIDFYNSLTLKT